MRSAASNSSQRLRCAILTIISIQLLALLSIHFSVGLQRFFLGTRCSNGLELRLDGDAIASEGIGAVISGLKPVLILADHTGASVTSRNKKSGHGYRHNAVLRFDESCFTHRVPCELSKPIDDILQEVIERCEDFDFQLLREYGVFRNCSFILISKYLSHPRKCLKYSQDFVRSFTKFEQPKEAEKEHVCVLRRGGDVEERILDGNGNIWAIDEKRTYPILEQLSNMGAKIFVSTETKLKGVQRRFHADEVSNHESLDALVPRLAYCKCLFIAAGSSFAAAIVQITQPTYIVHTESREGFYFDIATYRYEEYGPSAISILNTSQVINSCAPISKPTDISAQSE